MIFFPQNIKRVYGVVPTARLSAYDGETGGPWDAVQTGTNGMRMFGRLAVNL